MNRIDTRFRAPEIVAWLAFAWLAFLVLYLAGRPLGTDDFWWHLKFGEIYFRFGPWLAVDPLLHTATKPPDPAAWLFDISLHLLHRAFGFQGLRVVHVLLVGTIVWQVYGLFRRASGSTLAALAASAAWLSLSWYRLIQLRPDLVSVLATFLIVRLLFERATPPSWRRIALAMLVLVAWANSHALFLLGPMLCAAAVGAARLRGALARFATRRGVESPAHWNAPRPMLARFAAATGLGLLVTLLNPRGAARHFTFPKSSREEAIWEIADEWAPFDPFSWSDSNPAQSLLSFGIVDALFVLVVVLVVVGLVRVVRQPSRDTLQWIDPLWIGFSGAAFVAIVTAVRFEWLAVFPLLLLLHASRIVLRERPGLTWPARITAATVCVAMALALPTYGGYAGRAERVPRRIEKYLEKPIDGFKYYTQGVRFLRDAELAGKLFNSYFMGGYLGYWLAPALQIFVGGTLNYPRQIAIEHRAIASLDASELGVGPLELLDRNAVDVFFGVGLPIGGSPQQGALYTTANLEGAPGWTLVFRTLRSAVYLRANAHNLENLERVVAMYRRERVPFDPALGFDVDRVIRERPRWSVGRGLIPPEHPELVAASQSDDATVSAAALDHLGDVYAAVGAYHLQIENDRALLAADPGNARAHQRLIYGLLRLDQDDLADEYVERLMQIAGNDPRSRAFAIGAAQVAEARRRAPKWSASASAEGARSAIAIVNRLPLFTPAEATRVAVGG